MAQQILLNYACTCVVGARSALSQGYDQVMVPYFTKGSPNLGTGGGGGGGVPNLPQNWGTGVPKFPENRGWGSPILWGPQFCVTPRDVLHAGEVGGC